MKVTQNEVNEIKIEVKAWNLMATEDVQKPFYLLQICDATVCSATYCP